uniref:Uncharacterized protein n=1 Tax=viral metagenome TaxID=1070528 RepID=A0A6C0ADG9_9ZZZZ
MNLLQINNKYYKYESVWFRSKYRRDKNNKEFPRPKPKDVQWYNMSDFLEKLEQVEKFCRSKNNYEKYNKKDYHDCLICNEKNVGKGLFTMNRIRWEDSLYHYVKEHNIEPSNDFINMIFNFKNFNLITKNIGSLKSELVTTKEKMMIKLTKNQINIMDALMEHGGITKKYIDEDNNSFKYSEHAGLLDFDTKGLNKILIYGSTEKVSQSDDEIYLPRTKSDAYDYEYIFHTHPPTPKPGGRTDMGILYEFPSISDIFHFIEHYNNGYTQGSIVIAPEGMYNIRKKDFDRKKIEINRESFFNDIKVAFIEIETEAINKYGEKFTENDFYSKISQDRDFINKFNKYLNKYGINIDYYPRIKIKNRWIIDTVYLPVYPSVVKRDE